MVLSGCPACLMRDSAPQRTKGPKFTSCNRVSPSSCSLPETNATIATGWASSQCWGTDKANACCHVPIQHFISCSGSSHSEVLTLPGREPLGILTLSHVLGQSGSECSFCSVFWEHFTIINPLRGSLFWSMYNIKPRQKNKYFSSSKLAIFYVETV